MLTAGLVAAAVAALPVHVVEAALAVQLHVLVSPPLQQLGAAAAHAGWPGRGAACSSCRMHLSRQRRSRQSRHCAAAGHTPRHTSSASHQHRQRKQTKRSYEEELSVAARAWAKPGDEVWCIDKARFEFEYPLEHSQPASQPSQPSQPASQPASRPASRPAGWSAGPSKRGSLLLHAGFDPTQRDERLRSVPDGLRERPECATLRRCRIIPQLHSRPHLPRQCNSHSNSNCLVLG
jgi:hypothetical protein